MTAVAVKRLDGRSRVVGGKVEWWDVAQFPSPIGQVLLSLGGIGLGPFPGSVVAELDRERRQPCRPPIGKFFVQRTQIAEEHPSGGAIGRKVVAYDGDDVVVGAESDNQAAQQPIVSQVEGAANFLLHDLLGPCLPPRYRPIGHADEAARDRGRRVNGLPEAFTVPMERGPEDFVTFGQSVERLPECRRRESAGDPERPWHLVGGQAGVSLVYLPNEFLGKCRRGPRSVRPGPDNVRRRCRLVLGSVFGSRDHV